MVPVPLQSGQGLSESRPVPRHLGHMFAADCFEPGAVSSPGFRFSMQQER